MTKKNKSMVVVKCFANIRRNNKCQSPIRYFYNEFSLLDSTSLTDLINLYRPKIEWFDETYCVNVNFKFFKLWIKGKVVDLFLRYIERERKESLLARYLIALGVEIFKESDVVELYYLIHARLHSEDTGFADGLKIIHKAILIGNKGLFRTLLQVGFRIDTYTDKGDKFLPRSIP